MVIEKPTPIGIDFVISKIQNRLESKLNWSGMLTIYPKCYPVIRDGLKTIEYYYPNGQDYENLITAEQNKCFFVASEVMRKVDLQNYETELELFFTVDLKEIKNDNVRRDSEVHNDVLNALKGIPNITAKSLVVRVERVFYGYTYSIEDDMQPYHCFKLVINVDRFKPDVLC